MKIKFDLSRWDFSKKNYASNSVLESVKMFWNTVAPFWFGYMYATTFSSVYLVLVALPIMFELDFEWDIEEEIKKEK